MHNLLQREYAKTKHGERIELPGRYWFEKLCDVWRQVGKYGIVVIIYVDFLVTKKTCSGNGWNESHFKYKLIECSAYGLYKFG